TCRRGGRLQTLELGELLDQLLHAVTTKLYGKLGIFAVSFAREDDAFAVFGVAHAGSFAEAGAAGGRGNVHAGTAFEVERAFAGGSAFAEEGGGVVERAGAWGGAALAEALAGVGFCRAGRLLRFIFVGVVALGAEVVVCGPLVALRVRRGVRAAVAG